ncbi:MAG: polysulfide reductase NrfD [Syntrophaceae bacterium]|nr:polysulfide reductase NrfD [Syntrophaceae bacterium]
MISNEATKRMESVPVYDRNIPETCEIHYRTQTDWQLVEVLAIYFGGVGTGLYILSQIFGYTAGLIVGYLLVMVLKNIAHLLASSKPFKSIRVLSQPRTSWISRGSYGIFLFGILGLLDIALRAGFVQFDNAALPPIVSVMTAVAAFVIMAYVGFVFTEARNIDFWHSSIVPVMFICYSVAMGYALLIVLYALTQTQADFYTIAWQFLISLGATVLMVYTFMSVMRHISKSADEAVRILLHGKLAMMFWAGAIVAGLLVPICLTGYCYLTGSPAACSGLTLGIAGILTVLGGLFFQLCFVKAGVSTPIVNVD